MRPAVLEEIVRCMGWIFPGQYGQMGVIDMDRIPKPNEIYQHFKGNLYRVVTLATHSETGEDMVVYQALYGDFQVFVRPLAMFVSEVDHEKYPQVQAKYRFTLIPQIMGQPPEVPQVGNKTPQAGTPDIPEKDHNTGQEEFETAAPAEDGEEELNLDPMLIEFLDAETYEDKLNILVGMHSRITDDMLNTMAVSLDLELEEGDLEERYMTLKSCIVTLEKYECNRLR